mmetsp:Transcript_24685/g.55836  ORF Transcript_24685/g.55836 Transcript_24685/m.55836 type:complete len:226 (-) Transcript_24685:180-857(-)
MPVVVSPPLVLFLRRLMREMLGLVLLRALRSRRTILLFIMRQGRIQTCELQGVDVMIVRNLSGVCRQAHEVLIRHLDVHLEALRVRGFPTDVMIHRERLVLVSNPQHNRRARVAEAKLALRAWELLLAPIAVMIESQLSLAAKRHDRRVVSLAIVVVRVQHHADAMEVLPISKGPPEALGLLGEPQSKAISSQVPCSHHLERQLQLPLPVGHLPLTPQGAFMTGL